MRPAIADVDRRLPGCSQSDHRAGADQTGRQRGSRVPRLWQEVLDLVEPRQAPADAQVARRQEGQEVPALRQGLRQHAGVQHACEDSQSGLQVPLLRQVLLQAVATAGSHTYAHR